MALVVADRARFPELACFPRRPRSEGCASLMRRAVAESCACWRLGIGLLTEVCTQVLCHEQRIEF